MFLQQKKMLSSKEVKLQLPLSEELKLNKLAFDEKLRQNMLSRKQFVVVCGPCSADDPKAVGEYVGRLKKLADNCPNLLVVARIYTSKPRSNGLGYKGLCFGENGEDVNGGILACRQMMMDCLSCGLPVADELLYPEFYPYFDDLVSYYFVGARSSEDGLHRAFASGLDICCGVKNSTDGDLEKLAMSLQAVSMPTVFPFEEHQIKTNGCKFCHAVLRGGRRDGKFLSNISPDDVNWLKNQLKALNLSSFVMADVSHANSQKVAQNQIENAKMVIKNNNIDGIMLESYLNDGCDGISYGVSKTDECIGFDDTEKVLKMLDVEFANR